MTDQTSLMSLTHALAHERDPDRTLVSRTSRQRRLAVVGTAILLLIGTVAMFAISVAKLGDGDVWLILYGVALAGAGSAIFLFMWSCSDQTFERLSRAILPIAAGQACVIAVLGCLVGVAFAPWLAWYAVDKGLDIRELVLPGLSLQGIAVALPLMALRLLPPIVSLRERYWVWVQWLVRALWSVSFLAASSYVAALIWLGSRTYVAVGVGVALSIACLAHFERTRTLTNAVAREIRSALTGLYVSAGDCATLTATPAQWHQYKVDLLATIDVLENPVWRPLVGPAALRCDQAILTTLKFAAAREFGHPVPEPLMRRYTDLMDRIGEQHRHEFAFLVKTYAFELRAGIGRGV